MSTISYLISSYDAEQTLTRTIRSLVAQHDQRWQAVVVHVESGDRTAEVLDEFSDPRIRVLYERDRIAVGAARNLAARSADSAYLGLLDADDALEPRACGAQLAILESDPAADVIFGDAEVVDPFDQLIFRYSQIADQESPVTLTRLVETRPVPTSTVALRAEVFWQLEGFHDTLTTCEDYDLWYRAAVAGCRFRYVPQVLTKIMARQGGLSDDLDRYRTNMMSVLQRLLATRGLTDGERGTAQASLTLLEKELKRPDHEANAR